MRRRRRSSWETPQQDRNTVQRQEHDVLILLWSLVPPMTFAFAGEAPPSGGRRKPGPGGPQAERLEDLGKTKLVRRAREVITSRPNSSLLKQRM